MNKKSCIVLLLALMAFALSGCVVAARPVEVGPPPPVEYGYQPMLYQGYVVYYSPEGVPFYWYHGARYWVPEAHRDVYIRYWHAHGPAYREWYEHRGTTYRDYHGHGYEAHHPEPRHRIEEHHPEEHR